MKQKYKKPIVVASLFDGMSGAQLALKHRGIPVKKYHASEIDKYAISVTKKNFPNTNFVGDITQLNGSDLGHVDLVIGGSPCQGFSMASNGRLNFEHPQSKLFFEFIRVLRECQEINPNLFFVLENVRMANKHRDIITEELNVEPSLIDSALLSAQRRRRYYWTNIPGVAQPSDEGWKLKDILEDNAELPVYSNIYGGFNKPVQIQTEKSHTLITPGGGGHIPSVNKIYSKKEKVKVKIRKHKLDDQFVLVLRDCKAMAKFNKGISLKDIATHCDVPLTQAEHWFRKDSSFSIPPAEVWDKLKEILDAEIILKEYDKFITEFIERDGVYNMAERITLPDGKHPTLTARSEGGKIQNVDDKYYLTEKMKKFITKKPHNYELGDRNTTDPVIARPLSATSHKMHRAYQDTYVTTDYKPYNKSNVRKLTGRECERLQTVPDDYTAFGIDANDQVTPISNSQRYKMLGNGFTIRIVSHILSYMEDNAQPMKTKKQLKLL